MLPGLTSLGDGLGGNETLEVTVQDSGEAGGKST